ncbi:MAG TPA: hypothetical protein VI540_07070 [Gaiellaceae bacterium]|nr:hypothetical protein [Gaiellaceae bacterium]
MARYSAGVKTGAGSTTLPLASVYAAASVGGMLRQVTISNTTTGAVDLKLVRLTTAGTQGAGLTEAKHNPDAAAASCTAFTTHTVAPTLGDDLGYRWSFGAAIGAGVVETHGNLGLVIKPGTGNGIGVIVENGSGAAMQIFFVWDED